MARDLVVRILGDAASLERAFKKSARDATKFQQGMKRTSRTTQGVFGGLTRSLGLVTGALGVAGVAGAARAAFTELTEAQKVTAQTQAVLKSTGAVANVTAGQVDTLATSLLNVSGVDDEVIKSSENLLLTFTNIRNEVGRGNDIFNQATKAALDMSVALGQDMRQSALQLGKALQDPVKGVTALRRAGVALSAQQQDTIKNLVKTGRTLEAQKLILAELTKEFGGSAKAAGDTLGGKLNKLRETALNLGASIAQILTPSIENLVDRANKWLSNSKNQKAVLDTVKQAAGALKDVLEALKGAFEALNTITGSTKNTVKLLFAAFVAFKTAKLVGMLAGLASNVGLIGTKAQTATGQVTTLGGALKGLAPLALPLAAAAATVASTAGTSGPRAGPLKVSSLNDLVTYQDPVDGKWRMVTKTRGETPEQAARRDFERRHPGKALPTKAGVDVRDRQPGRSPAGAGAFTAPTTAGAGTPAAKKRRASLTYQMSLLELQLAKAELTASKLDDRAVLVRQAALVRRQIAATKDLKARTEFYQQLAGINQQIQAIDDEAAETAKTQREKQLEAHRKEIEKTKEHARKLREAAKKHAAAVLEAQTAAQFRALGLTGTGEERVPTARALGKQLGKLATQIRGTALDTKAWAAFVDRVRKVLSGKFGQLSREVRQTIQQMLEEWASQVEEGPRRRRRRNIINLVDTGWGHGTNPFGNGGAVGGSFSGGVVIHNLNLHGVQDVRQLENELIQRSNSRPQPRRGP